MARRKEPVTELPADPAGEPAAQPAEQDVIPDPGPPADALPPLRLSEPEPAPIPRRSGVLGPLLGGALAALGGFGLSHFNVFGVAAPNGLAEVAALQAEVQALAKADGTLAADLAAGQGGLQQSIEQFEARLEALETMPAPTAPDLSRLDTLEERMAAIEALPAGADASTAALAAKLAELERRLSALPAGGVDQAEVDAALARLKVAEAEAAARAEEAAAAAAAAKRAEALDHLRATVASGAGFEAELAALGDAALTEALVPHVAGVATLAQLQAEFPDAARLSLQLASDAAGEEGWGGRLVDFLAAQTGARSLTPREGDDADAVLSRAEFALSEGRLADALAELEALDPAVRAPFDGWAAKAEARLSVDTALEAG